MPTGAHDIEGCFADDDETVIGYKGSNYYKACGVVVMNYGNGATSSCVKRQGHQSLAHEDYDGQVRVR